MTWIQLEIKEIYDGWILEYNPETKEIKWRDHHVVEGISEKKKQQIINNLIKSIENG